MSSVIVLARPHPLHTDLVRCDFPVGSSIAEMVGEARLCRVEVGGMTIPEEWWPRIRPHAGIAVHITRYPQGGSVKSILRIVAFAALAVGVIAITGGAAAIGLPGLLGGSLGTLFAAGSISAGLLAAGVGLIGSLVINALIPPAAPGGNLNTQSTDTLRSITGSSNQANRFGVIPCVVGVMKMFPPYAAQPWTELLGDDQYLRCLFDGGSGNVLLSDMKIGNSDLATYAAVQTEVGTSPGLFSQDVAEAGVGVEMDTDGLVTLRTSGTAADELSLDLVFPSGLFGIDSNGNSTRLTCQLAVEYAPTGTTSFLPAAHASQFSISEAPAYPNGDGTITADNSARKAVRIGMQWKVPNGQYDVRVTRIHTNIGSTASGNAVSALNWTVLRTIRYTAASHTQTTKVALRIKATDQLNGTISQFNFIGAQTIPTWNGTAWVDAVTENCAWVYRWLLKDCPANPRPVDPARIDDEALIEWAAECKEKEFTFSTVLDQPTTIFALLQNVCAAGRASFNVKDGKYSVVRDVAQDVPVQIFTPRNSDAFTGSRAFPDQIHALRVQFTNPAADYQQDERIVYDDGFGDAVMVAANPSLRLAKKFETYPIVGCTNANAAWRLGRYHMACLRLRPNTCHWTADIENLVCSRGDLVYVANDIIAVGLAWGRIKSTTVAAGLVTEIQTDEAVVFEDGTAYAVWIRRQDGSSATSVVTSTVYGEVRQMVLSTPLAGISGGDLFTFGIREQEILPMIITKIEPSQDLAAKLTAVDASSAVLAADAGPVPAWSSSITGQPYLDTPEPPSGLMVNSPQAIATPDDAGNTTAIVSITVLQSSRILRVA